MSHSKKLDGYISICAKAGKLVFGEDAIVSAAQKGSVFLLLLDESAGPNTADRIRRLSAHHGIPLLEVPALGQKAGKTARVCAAVRDQGLSTAMLNADDIH